MTIYLTGAVNKPVLGHASREDLGLLITPDTRQYGRHIETFELWAADNACFSQVNDFDPERWYDWLASLPTTALFATAPDVVGVHEATLARSAPYFEVIRTLGHRAAFVAQNGATPANVPWDDFDVLFIGGVLECRACGYDKVPGNEEGATDCTMCKVPRTYGHFRCSHCPYCDARMTEWKLSDAAVELIDEAHRRGMWVHVGRVNGARRFAWCVEHDVESADGTYLAFGPDTNLPKLLSWLNDQSEARLALAA